MRGNRTAALPSLPSEPATAGDLISFLKALPDCRMRRGVRFPQWWMLLVAILAILCNEGSLVGIERFARRHREVLNALLGTDFGKEPSDSTFLLLLWPCRCVNRRCGSWPGLTPCIWMIPAVAAAAWSLTWPEKGSRSAAIVSETSCGAWVYGRSTRNPAPRFQAIHPSGFRAWWISGCLATIR